MTQQQDNFVILTLPPGRLVWGSAYKPQTTDLEGKPILIKTGPNAGQPGKRWQFGVAIRKGAEQAWYQTQWGARFFEVAQRGFPNGAFQRPDFSWKVTDGDSAVPNKRGKAPNTVEHNRGHWIVAVSTAASAPPVYRKNDTGQFVQVVGEEIIKPGYYVEVNIKIEDNAPSQSPGLYVSPRMIAFAGFGPEIISGPDVNEAGFGQAPLPAGASAVPLGGAALPGMPPMGAVFPGAPAAGMPPLPGAAPMGFAHPGTPAVGIPVSLPVTPQVPAQPAAPMVVQPNPAFLQPPALGFPQPAPGMMLPPLQPLQPAAPVYVMTAAANGGTREQYNQQGYTDAQLIAAGYMVQQ